MLIIFTGNGKGKTTAALGQAVRALGNGKRVAFIQFIKSPKWPTGEEQMLKGFGKKCMFYKGGLGFVGIMGDFLPRSAHKKAARDTWSVAKKAILGKAYELVVLDEINVAVALKLLAAREVAAVLRNVSPDKDIVLTGRYAPKEFARAADLVTECREVKHPFQKGKWGERGREY